MANKPSLLLYLHGFNSSPQSHKAKVMKAYCQQHRPDILLLAPQIPCFPEQAAQFLLATVERYKGDYTIGLVGSSLGGYMSTWLNHQFGFRAVLINPAVKPYELLVDFLGEQVNPYTQQSYQLEHKHIDELQALDVVTLTQPGDFWLMQQEGDEVLDYRQAVAKYAQSKQTIEEKGDHSFVGFERFPEHIISFLKL
ncbi:esterase YqiA [Vibrio sp. 10N.286.49.B3]|uniref:esterase YqiA n=1 Tax=Vibrio sp. 10N.286.49.B3 TaxID=1880855 RepID=UPI000C84164B|nr:esterase YqiA [Vibrio sp. 10N.286.49.B3]PMH39810.1 esterase YqiA [Vibrio sp. 10N.286.49.B3]